MSPERIAATKLTAIRGQGQMAQRAVRRLSAPASRCRPGEVPRWVRLDVSLAQGSALREAAVAAGVAVDVWLAVTLELACTLPTAAVAFGSADAARTQLAQLVELQPVPVARTGSWRVWQASLARREPSERDELPEVVLPERLLARLGESVDVDVALAHAADWPLARSCELVACGHGRTLEVYLLELALHSRWADADRASGRDSC